LLNRVSLFNQVFGYGKMHAVAKVTAKVLELPFRVTSSFALQRFMNSSYLSLKNLETNYEAYVETFKDHDNEEELLYKLCGSDFIFDLCGVLDTLWPLVVLMLKAQLQWCSGWKFPAYVIAVVKQIRRFSVEVFKKVPSEQVSPRLHNHGKDIEAFRFGKSTLVLGWMLQKKGNSRKRNGDGEDDKQEDDKEGDDDKEDDEEDDDEEEEAKKDKAEMFYMGRTGSERLRKDLKELADEIIEQLETRFANCYPELNHLILG
jgi:hypothetical protein